MSHPQGETGLTCRDDGIALILIAEPPKKVIKLAIHLGNPGLRREDDRFLWVFQTRRYPVIDDQPVQEVKLRIMGVLFSDEIPDARDIVIISLSDACGIFRGLLSSRELRGAAPRIEQVGKMPT